MRVIGSFEEYERVLPQDWRDSHAKITEASRVYLKHRGVLKVSDENPPKLFYPSKQRIAEQIKESQDKRKYLNNEVMILKKNKNEHDTNTAVKTAKRFVDPLFWEHTFRNISNKEYKHSFDTVDLPLSMMSDPKQRKILRMFIKNPEYRERLVEARTSELGKRRDSMRQSMEKTGDFRTDVIDNRVKKLMAEHDSYLEKERALEVLGGWTQTVM